MYACLTQDTFGLCLSECRTIEYGCKTILKRVEDDLAEWLYTQKYSEATLVDKVCVTATKVCGVEVGPVPDDREPGDPFITQPATDRELDILSHTIRSTGWWGDKIIKSNKVIVYLVLTLLPCIHSFIHSFIQCILVAIPFT